MTKRRQNKGARLPKESTNEPLDSGSSKQNKVVEQSRPDTLLEPIVGIKSLLEDEDCQPSTSSTVDSLSTNTAALYDELDSFRLRWRRELEVTKQPETKPKSEATSSRILTDKISRLNIVSDSQSEKNPNQEDVNKLTSDHYDCEGKSSDHQTYATAKKLFLIAVDLEQDEMHHESIRYYKQAMHLCPDIEKQIFREQCEASAEASGKSIEKSRPTDDELIDEIYPTQNEAPLHDRIRERHYKDSNGERYTICKPIHKLKSGTVHISDLPQELILQIYRYVIGEELDLAALESIGLVCRGFYLLTRDASLWRSICYSAWGDEMFRSFSSEFESNKENINSTASPVDWRQMFLERPRVNFDGVYISRTRYIRQGDVGFQDITYRPFHVIRYYRYLRFFPDRRVLILTTNEEPDKIVPIFRHALHSKQFSPELSILEGSFEFVSANQIYIVAEKNFRSTPSVVLNQRRAAQFHWSRQTPLSQKFNLKFELKTVENKPYRNNVLKWLDYTILTRLETGQEITTFDVAPDTFPNLIFSRVKRFNLKLTNPLSSH